MSGTHDRGVGFESLNGAEAGLSVDKQLLCCLMSGAILDYDCVLVVT